MLNSIVILASGIILNKDNEILLLKRSNSTKTFQGYWQLPEGKKEFGEQVTDALKREIAEEISLSVTSLKYLGSVSKIFQMPAEQYDVTRFVFLVICKIGKIKLSPDHVAYEWFTKEDALLIDSKIPGLVEVLELI